MVVLVLAILIGIAISLFSTQNTHGVTITLANYPLTGVPLYIIATVSFLLGIIISFIGSLFSSISSFFALHSKDAAITQANTTIKNLKNRVQELELENTRLRGHKHSAYID